MCYSKTSRKDTNMNITVKQNEEAVPVRLNQW